MYQDFPIRSVIVLILFLLIIAQGNLRVVIGLLSLLKRINLLKEKKVFACNHCLQLMYKTTKNIILIKR